MPDRHSPSFLDLLPDSVCERIATFVSGGRQTETALSLAEVSPTFREAVVYALRRTFRVEESSARGWAAVFATNAREVSIDISDAPLPPAIFDQLRAPSLRIARVPALPVLLSALSEGASVLELTVLLVQEDHVALLHALEHLALTRLNICCFPYHYPEACVAGLFRKFGTDAIAKRCPALQALDIRCFCRNILPMSPVLSSFVCLREVTLSAELSEEALPILRRMESVRLNGSIVDGAAYAVRIGRSVTSIEETECFRFREEKIVALKQCDRLQKVTLRISRQMEVAVSELVKSLPQLRALYLQWTLNSLHHYHKPAAGFILGMVESVGKLEELGLVAVSISREEVQSVLRHIGGRLRRCEMSVAEQGEAAYTRLGTLFDAMSTYNRSLEDFVMTDYLFVTPYHGMMEVKDRMRADLCRSKEFLLRHMPTVDEKRLDEFIGITINGNMPFCRRR